MFGVKYLLILTHKHFITRNWLSLPATSVPCERIWSNAGNIVTKKRAALDLDSVSMLICNSHNISECKRIGKKFTWE